MPRSRPSAGPNLDIVLAASRHGTRCVRHQPALMCKLQNIGGIVRLAAELARQRPFRAGTVAMDAADHPAAGRGARHLLDLGLAVDGEQRDAELERGAISLSFLMVLP